MSDDAELLERIHCPMQANKINGFLLVKESVATPNGNKSTDVC